MASIIRISARQVVPSFSRSISVSAVAKKDLVQDLYVSQLKAYKAPPASKDAASAHVRSFTPPSAPKAPTLPSDLAAELAKFDKVEPTLGATSSKAATSGSAATGGESADEYLSFLEQDLPKKDAHH